MTQTSTKAGIAQNPMLADALVHFGSHKYNPELIKPIKNKNWIKPEGGLWTSPISSNWGWKDWCECENFRDCDDGNSFRLILNEDAKVFIIDRFNDLKNAPIFEYRIGNDYVKSYLDFESIAKDFDAIWLTENGQKETHLSYPLDLYGWDCESVLILNPSCCKEVTFAGIC